MTGDRPTEARGATGPRGLATLALVALLLGAAGCASSDEDLRADMRAQRNQALYPLSPADLARHPSGSPQRTLLEAWRALQFRDVTTTISLLTPKPPRRTVRIVEDYLLGPGAELTATAQPLIRGARVRGDRAEVTVQVERRVEESNRVVSRLGPAIELSLERRAGEWMLPYRKLVPQLRAALL